MTSNPDELERLARAATPGPWKACMTIYEHMNCELRSGAKGEGQAIAQFWDGPNAFADGQFAAAANPATILALLSANREMREALEEIYNLADSFKPVLTHICPPGCLPTRGQEDLASILAKPFFVARSALTTQRGE